MFHQSVSLCSFQSTECLGLMSSHAQQWGCVPGRADADCCAPADASASNIQFYLIGQSAGSVPSLQLGLGNNAAQYYCQSQQTTSLTKGQTMNGYTQFTVPLSTFHCDLTRWDCCVLPSLLQRV